MAPHRCCAGPCGSLLVVAHLSHVGSPGDVLNGRESEKAASLAGVGEALYHAVTAVWGTCTTMPMILQHDGVCKFGKFNKLGQFGEVGKVGKVG